MRNLKRALSLTLASVMLLGMMVIGTSAAAYTDEDQISNVTAAAVLKETKVMLGNGDKFMPNQTVTRAQMAIIVCKLIYGADVNVKQFEGETQFTDIPANAYYTGYVNLATSLGIISGYGNGKFGPSAPVTTAQAALMLTKALGYFQNEGELGSSWILSAITKATDVGLFGNLGLNRNEPLSRDNVSELVFNAMTKATPVAYNETWNVYYTQGTSWTNGVIYLEDDEVGDASNAGYKLTYGYKNFDLEISQSASNKKDDMGRPCDLWQARGKDIIEVAKTPVQVYTSDMTSNSNKDVVKRDLSAYDLDAKKFTVQNNGDPGTEYNDGTPLTSDIIAGMTADGKLVEIYANKYNEITDVVTMTAEDVKVTGLNTTKKTVTLGAIGTLDETDGEPYEALYGNVKVGDVVMIVKKADKTVLKAYLPTVVEGKVTYVKKDGKEVTVDGETYKTAGGAALFVTGNLNKTGKVYLDEYGYAHYTDFTGTTSADYIMLTDIYESETTENGVKTTKIYARGINTDGETVTLEIRNKKDGSAPADFTGITTGSAVGNAYQLVKYDSNDDGKLALGATWSNAATNSPLGVVAEYKESTTSSGAYVLLVPNAPAAAGKNSGTDALDATISNTTKSFDGYPFATDVKFVYTYFVDSTTKSDLKEVKVLNNVQSVTLPDAKITKATYVTTTDADDNKVISTVFLAVNDDIIPGEGSIYLKEGMKGTEKYENADGKLVDGYRYESFEGSSDKVVIIATSGSHTAGFYKTKTEGQGVKLTPVTGNKAVDILVKSIYGSTVTLADGSALEVKDDAVVDLSDNGITTVEGMKEWAKSNTLRVSADWDVVNSEKVAKVVYITDVFAGEVKASASVNNSSTATHTQTGAAPAKGDTGEETAVVSGTVKTGIATSAQTDMGTTTIAGYTNYTTASITMPAGSYGIRQTNELLKSNTWTGADIDRTEGVKLKAYANITAGEQLYFAIAPGHPVTLEFDWDYTGTSGHDVFEADYTITVDASGLTIVP